MLGFVLAIGMWAALPLLDAGNWVGLALVIGVTALLFWIYLSRRTVPAKYLIPGTLFLIAFQVFPVLYTMSTAFTNFGDRAPGQQAGGDPVHRGRVDPAGAGLAAVRAVHRRQGRPGDW